MQAFIDFYEEKQNIIQSLMESCSDPKTCDVAFGVLTKAEFFLESLFWCEGKVFDKIYEHATEKVTCVLGIWRSDLGDRWKINDASP